jgi:pilus assembly protein CpaB
MNPARIIVLLIALLAGGVAAYLFYQPEAPAPVAEAPKADTVNVLVAATDIGMGVIVTEKELQWMAWPTSAPTDNFITEKSKPTAIADLKGSIARFAFVRGEPIREAKLIKANGSGFMAAILPSGKRAISFEISPETGAGGFILPNDYVDVLLTQRLRNTDERRGGSEAVRSAILLSDVRVLAIDQTVEEKDGQRVVVGKTATVELNPDETTRLSAARQTGTLSLALRSITDANKTNRESAEAEVQSDVNIVRFGVGGIGSSQ